MAKRTSSEIELVMVSVVSACRHFCHYLLQWPFVFLMSYTFLPQLINSVNMSKAAKKWVLIELQEFEFSLLVEESMRATSANLLTYKETPFFIKEEMVKKVAKKLKDISNAHVLFFEGSYRKIHDAASASIVVYDPQGKLVCKQGFKVDALSKKEAEYSTLDVGLHTCIKHGLRRLCIKGDALLVVK